MDRRIRRVVILGGGSAGWLTAGLLAAVHRPEGPDGLQVTLIESPETPPIGVGEGTWPSMRDTLARIGVSETGLVRQADAAFKQGSRFDGWVDGSRGDHYFHPFMLPHGYLEADLAGRWLQEPPVAPFAYRCSVQPHLCRAGTAPKQRTTPEYAAVANYGYHFDATKFGLFLRDHAIAHGGVEHVLDTVQEVVSHEDGDIAALRTKSGRTVDGDLFVDCSGLPSLLLGRHYGVRLVSQRHVLFNDRALAVPVPYADEQAAIASQTISTAQPQGWIWDIGLPTRRGVGIVFSSAHASADEAEATLLRHLRASGVTGELPSPRLLSFEPGYRERFWHRNCLAIGLAGGFIEPLEASALAMVELAAAALCDDLPATRGTMDIVARRFNEGFGYRWSRIIDFLKLHYVLSQRTDSAYWRDHREPASVPDRLREQLQLWQHRPPSRLDFQRAEEVFPSASYQYVLYGMGFRPESAQGSRRAGPCEKADGYFTETVGLVRRMLPALPSHRSLIDHIRLHGQMRV